MKGKLIVLEGIDGSGKSTQYRMLCDKLLHDGINFTHIVFPRYTEESSALIRMYLSGKFGMSPVDVNAYTASTFYAVDRFASYKSDWGQIYNNGGIILSDRYTTSNAIHQGSKLDDSEIYDFFDWLKDLEYSKMCLPEPDMVLYLDCDIETSVKRMQQRELETSTTADIHEKDISYLKDCLHAADIACNYFGWNRIACKNNGIERSIGDKNSEIYEIVRKCIDTE